MAQRKTLTEKQLSVLQWIGDGCPDGVDEGDLHKISAAALRRRGHATINGRGSAWSATITKAGTEYLVQARGSNPPIPRQPNVSVTQQFVDELIARGGKMSLEDVDYETRQRYERRSRDAASFKKLPPDKRIRL